ncbi:MAG: DUF2062 domain-containing protein [Vicinamibacteria bacterium]|nr:DUF2062 domain-containing protein [Vicinamibacteria bacterium]
MAHRLQRFGQLLLRVNDSPHRTALAFGVGVFIAFFPVIGVHTAMAFAIAFFFRLNRVALLLGAYINNPWTLGPLFSLGTLIGCFLTGVSPNEIWSIDWSLAGHGFCSEMLDLARQFIWPFIVGNLSAGLIASLLSYGVARRILTRGRVSVVSSRATADSSS